MNPITKEGEVLLREELKKLKLEDRPRIIDAIASAREFGDLKENAEYHAAKEEQSLAEARIRDIESKLSGAQVIDVTTIEPSDKVIFGTTVIVVDDNNKKVTYKIVGEDEADIKIGKLSVTSPISRSLVGKNEGEIVVIKTPSGEKEYEIIEVKYV